jgi:hypothetical protein
MSSSGQRTKLDLISIPTWLEPRPQRAGGEHSGAPRGLRVPQQHDGCRFRLRLSRKGAVLPRAGLWMPAAGGFRGSARPAFQAASPSNVTIIAGS